jgi:hypothetical protein
VEDQHQLEVTICDLKPRRQVVGGPSVCVHGARHGDALDGAQEPRAIAVNIEIIRAFVRLRATLVAHADLSARIDALEQRYDDLFRAVFQAIRQLMEPMHTPPRRIGFRRHE